MSHEGGPPRSQTESEQTGLSGPGIRPLAPRSEHASGSGTRTQSTGEITTRCLAIVDKFKEGDITKELAIRELRKYLPNHTVPPSSYALTSYISIIESHEEAANRGNDRNRSRLREELGREIETPDNI